MLVAFNRAGHVTSYRRLTRAELSSVTVDVKYINGVIWLNFLFLWATQLNITELLRPEKLLLFHFLAHFRQTFANVWVNLLIETKLSSVLHCLVYDWHRLARPLNVCRMFVGSRTNNPGVDIRLACWLIYSSVTTNVTVALIIKQIQLIFSDWLEGKASLKNVYLCTTDAAQCLSYIVQEGIKTVKLCWKTKQLREYDCHCSLFYLVLC